MNKKLKKIIDFAYNNVPYYDERKKIDVTESSEKQWEKIPILTKNEVVMNRNKFISNQSLANYINGQLHMEHTSGSTGKCLNIYWEKSDYQRSLLPLYFLRKKYGGIHPEDKLCFFYTVRSSDKEDVEFVEKNRSLSFSKSNLNEDRIKNILDKIKKFEPVWIIGQPSVLLLLAETMIKSNYSPIKSIRYIELTGEMLFPMVREQISKAFRCKIVNHYGTVEVSSIAYECPCGNLHLTDCTYTEIVDQMGNVLPDGEEGEVCVTSLVNRAMPLIRYKIGDRASLFSAETCSCGLNNKVLKLMTGRINEYVVTQSGEQINSYIFPRAVQVVNYQYPEAIRQFQVTQLDYLLFLVSLVLDDEYDEKCICQLFVDSIWQAELVDAEYQFEIKNALFPSINGKLKCFVNKIYK